MWWSFPEKGLIAGKGSGDAGAGKWNGPNLPRTGSNSGFLACLAEPGSASDFTRNDKLVK